MMGTFSPFFISWNFLFFSSKKNQSAIKLSLCCQFLTSCINPCRRRSSTFLSYREPLSPPPSCSFTPQLIFHFHLSFSPPHLPSQTSCPQIYSSQRESNSYSASLCLLLLLDIHTCTSVCLGFDSPRVRLVPVSSRPSPCATESVCLFLVLVAMVSVAVRA